MTETHPSPSGRPRVGRDEVRDLTRLRRPTDGRMVAGVAEGLSRHFDVDPLVVRIVFAVLTFFGGAGIILYAIVWLCVPQEDEYDSWLSGRLRRDPDRVQLAGLAVAGVLSVVAMLSSIGWAAPHPWPMLWLAVIALVLFAVFSRHRNGDESRPERPAAATDSLPDRPGEESAPPGTATLVETPITAPPRPRPARRPRPPRSHLFALTMAVIAIAMGGIWLYDASGYRVEPSVYPGTVLAITAAALLVGTWYGRSRLLIVVGLLATLATMATTIVGTGPIGEVSHNPTSAALVQDRYTLGAGQLNVHLMGVQDPEALDGRTVDVDAEVGEVNVLVPSGVDLVVNAEVEGGEIYGVPDIVDGRSFQEVSWAMPDDADPDLTLDIQLRFGEINVLRAVCTGSDSWVTEALYLPEHDRTSTRTGSADVQTCN